MKAMLETDTIPLVAKSPFELRTNLGNQVPESDVRKAIASGEMAFVHSFTTGSTLDGPGVRIVVWLTGCHFRCVYCHNPDTWTLTNGIPVTISRAIEQLRKYQNGLKNMRGGLTISGGEPLMQHKFVIKLFTAAQRMGLHTALDTNGSLGARLADQELQCISLVLLDIKCWNEERHRLLTGVDIGTVLAFARRLAVRKRPVWLRYVLVPGWTDDAAEIDCLAAFAASLGNVERVDVLPFHQMGQYKWKQLGIDYKLENLAPPSQALVDRVCGQFRDRGLAAY
jgi:pyruvate formate lyase activating enzyme